MLVGISFVIEMIGNILTMILALQIPTGTGTYISFRALIIYIALLGLAFNIVKIFLTKGNNKNGKD